mmetsp:Transcript_6900/g.12285  ORF Transcript_6900/g.12285 Transcript_6900/m.12285 type:complete len:101 (+) Transcript_6900:1120-1422(+)
MDLLHDRISISLRKNIRSILWLANNELDLELWYGYYLGWLKGSVEHVSVAKSFGHLAAYYMANDTWLCMWITNDQSLECICVGLCSMRDISIVGNTYLWE